MSRAPVDDTPNPDGAPITPKPQPSPSLLRLVAGFLLLENLVLAGLVVALLELPSGSGTSSSQGSDATPSEAGKGASQVLVGQMSVPVFDQETLALQDYLGRLDRLVDIKTVLARRPDLNEIAAKRNAAYDCTRFACPALGDWVVLVRSMGRHIPNPPRWSGEGAHLAETMAVADYIEILTEKIDQAERLSGRNDLMPSNDTLEAARHCQNTDCKELSTLVEQAAASLASVGETIPPLPPDVGSPSVVSGGSRDGSAIKTGKTGRRAEHPGKQSKDGKGPRRGAGAGSADDDDF